MYKFDYQNQENTTVSPKQTLFIFILFLFMGLFAGQMIAALVVFLPRTGFDIARFENLVENSELIYSDIYLSHALQGVFMLVSFIITPIIYLQFIEKKDLTCFSHPKSEFSKQGVFIALSFLMILAVYPLSLKIREFTVLGMENGFFGAFGSEMLKSELSQQKLIESMLNVTEPFQVVSLILVIAVLPALGEELVFRGVMQNVFIKLKLNPYLAIVVTAFIFSALHLNLTDFVPRLILGSVLGLSYYLSKNFLVPVILHFINNFLSVVYYLMLEGQSVNYDVESKGAVSMYVVVIGVMLSVLVFMALKRNSKKQFGEA